MGNSLPCGLTTVHADVVTVGFKFKVKQDLAHIQQGENRQPFLGSRFKDIADMSFSDNEKMPLI